MKTRPILLATVPFLVVLFTTSVPAQARKGRKPVTAGLSLAGLSSSLEELSANVAPAIVSVFATAVGTADGANGPDMLVTQVGTGSGAFIDPRGLIVTSAHVVDTAKSVSVMLSTRVSEGSPRRSILGPRGRRLEARVVGMDVETDIALLVVEGEDYPFLSFADSDQLQAGQLVMAFGSPLGLANSVSMGVISAPARQLEPEAPMVYIQTDAPINPGNSGGPLVNADGELVGLNTLILSQGGGSDGIGFAVPSNIVSHVVTQLVEHGRVRRGVIGVLSQTITPEMAIGLDLKRNWGVILGDVQVDSPAYFAGLEAGDIVLRLGGKVMENARQLDVNLYGKPLGEEVQLKVLRGAREFDVSVVVVERAGDPLRFADLVDSNESIIPRLGVLGLSINDDLRRLVPGLGMEKGVLVAARAPGAPPTEEDFRLGDIILSLNGQKVSDLVDVRVTLARIDRRTPIIAHVERDGFRRFLTLGSE